MANLVTYRHVWTHRNRAGDWEYGYECTWSDGSVSHEFTLPWGRMDGAKEIDKDGNELVANTYSPKGRRIQTDYGNGSDAGQELVYHRPG